MADLKEPLKKLDAAVAPRPTRHYRAAVFQAYVLMSAGAFVVLAVGARLLPYFPIDLTVTHAVQKYHGVIFDRVMFAMSWIGFLPQSLAFGLVPIAILALAGLRWEALVGLGAAAAAGVAGLVKIIVHRPRPSIDLVQVLSELPTSAFPSGHVLTFTVMCGYFAFLAHTLLKPSWERTALLVVIPVLALLMGLSRIYQGQHWFSDVMGAYLLGSLWLALIIRVYRWGKPRYFVHQPVAAEAPKTGGKHAPA
jgi:undecaprenyl-diphosphatase